MEKYSTRGIALVLMLIVVVLCVADFKNKNKIDTASTTTKETITQVASTTEKEIKTTTDSSSEEKTTKKVESTTKKHIEKTTKKELEKTTQKTKETTTKKQINNINNEINAENARHNQAIQEINQKYNSSIESSQQEADYWRNYAGYGSSYSYTIQINQLNNEIIEKESQLMFLKMDTSGMNASKIRSLERELENDYAELNDLTTKQMYAQMAENFEAEVTRLKREKNSALNEENALHEENLENIYANA